MWRSSEITNNFSECHIIFIMVIPLCVYPYLSTYNLSLLFLLQLENMEKVKLRDSQLFAYVLKTMRNKTELPGPFPPCTSQFTCGYRVVPRSPLRHQALGEHKPIAVIPWVVFVSTHLETFKFIFDRLSPFSSSPSSQSLLYSSKKHIVFLSGGHYQNSPPERL